MNHDIFTDALLRHTGSQNTLFATLALCLLSLWFSTTASAAFTIAAPKDVHNDYLLFVSGRDVHKISEFTGLGARRDVVEMVLMHQALKLGGFQQEIEIVSFDGYKRTLQMIQTGRLAAFGPSAWNSPAVREDKNLLISEPLIHEGEFKVGLFTSQKNNRALAVQNFDTLRQLSGVSNRNWERDWRLLESLQLSSIHHTLHWVSMAKMVEAQRADFVLAPFSYEQDMSLQVGDIKLIPIKGLKVTLPGSRHWIVSRRHESGTDAFNALQLGLQILREKGSVNKAYMDSGFFNPKTLHWKTFQAQM
jgi:hypothetical protein